MASHFRAPDPIQPVDLEVGTTYELVLRVRATCTREGGHGRCYAIVLEQRDFTAERAVPVWLDQDELLVAVPDVPRPTPHRRALDAAESYLARNDPSDADLTVQQIAKILRGDQ